MPDEEEWDKLEAQLLNAARKLHDPSANILALEEKIRRVPIEVDGVTHTLTADIDRIETQESTGGSLRYRIIDYKTGRAWKSLTEPKDDDLQMGVYALALSWQFGFDELPDGRRKYWLLETGERGVIDFTSLRMDKIEKKIHKAVRGMLAGEWKKGNERQCSGLCEMFEW